MARRAGFTLLEVLVALAVVGILFGAIAMLQVQSVRASATARELSQVKAEANLVLEHLLEMTTAVTASGYMFSHYYGDCGVGTDVNGGTTLECNGSSDTLTDFDENANIDTAWAISDVPGATTYEKEGVMLLTVTSAWDGGSPSVTLGSAITCYDFFSGASANTPEPCPEPQSPGGAS